MTVMTKIEEYGIVHIVEAGVDAGKSTRTIADECNEYLKSMEHYSGQSITHATVANYLKADRSEEQAEKKEIILQDRRRILKTVNQELDIIQLQLETTQTLLSRFQLIDDMPEMFTTQMGDLINRLEDDAASAEYIAYLKEWTKTTAIELKRKVLELTSLNRELRENSKFLAEIRAKAFAFSLVQEYLALFMQKFREESTDGAFERTIQWISANPRMQQIVDQQRLLMDL